MFTLTITKLLVEIAVIALIILGYMYEDKIIKFERAFVGAIIWTIEEHKENKNENIH